MGLALLAFAFYLAVGAVAVTIFWALQIRFGRTSDLDPNSLLVRLFRRRSPTAEPATESATSPRPASPGSAYAELFTLNWPPPSEAALRALKAALKEEEGASGRGAAAFGRRLKARQRRGADRVLEAIEEAARVERKSGRGVDAPPWQEHDEQAEESLVN